MGLGNFIRLVKSDICAAKENDPAATSTLEILLAYHTFHAIFVHRINHKLYKLGLRTFPRMISMFMRMWSGIEIHPGAKIGEAFFIDHGTGTVIGETSEIGKNCVMFQGVGLGGTGKHKGKRHPTIGNNCLIGAGAILLGPIKVGNNVKIGADTFIIMHDVPDNCTVVGTPGIVVRKNGKKVRTKLNKTNAPKET